MQMLFAARGVGLRPSQRWRPGRVEMVERACLQGGRWSGLLGSWGRPMAGVYPHQMRVTPSLMGGLSLLVRWGCRGAGRRRMGRGGPSSPLDVAAREALPRAVGVAAKVVWGMKLLLRPMLRL